MHFEPMFQAQSQQRPQMQIMQAQQVQQPHFLVGCMSPFSQIGQLPLPPELMMMGAWGAGCCIIMGAIMGWGIIMGAGVTIIAGY